MDRIQNYQKILCFHNQRIAVRQKYLLDIRRIRIVRNLRQICQNLRQAPDPELLFFIHIAKAAGVVCTSDRHLCRTARICSDSFLFFCILRVFYRLPRQREIHTRFQLQHRVVRPGIVQDRLQPCQPEIIAAVTDPVLICLAFSDLCHINLRARTIITVHIGIEPCHLFFDIL